MSGMRVRHVPDKRAAGRQPAARRGELLLCLATYTPTVAAP
jgi:hypothetical protein